MHAERDDLRPPPLIDVSPEAVEASMVEQWIADGSPLCSWPWPWPTPGRGPLVVPARDLPA